MTRETTPDPSVSMGWSAYLADLQSAVPQIEAERGTLAETVEHKVLILAEEAFEILKAFRSRAGVATDSYRSHDDVDRELVDVLFVSAAIANRISASLNEAVERLTPEPANAPSVPSEEVSQTEAMQWALDVADGVLSVVAASRDESAARPAMPEGALSRDRALEQGLARVVVSVLVMAERTGADLERVTSQKLRRDQLRLWTTT